MHNMKDTYCYAV